MILPIPLCWQPIKYDYSLVHEANGNAPQQADLLPPSRELLYHKARCHEIAPKQSCPWKVQSIIVQSHQLIRAFAMEQSHLLMSAKLQFFVSLLLSYSH